MGVRFQIVDLVEVPRIEDVFVVPRPQNPLEIHAPPIEPVELSNKTVAELEVHVIAHTGKASGVTSLGDAGALSILTWSRTNCPATKRLLAATAAEPALLVAATNSARIHHFCAMPADDSDLRDAVEHLIFG